MCDEEKLQPGIVDKNYHQVVMGNYNQMLWIKPTTRCGDG